MEFCRRLVSPIALIYTKQASSNYFRRKLGLRLNCPSQQRVRNNVLSVKLYDHINLFTGKLAVDCHKIFRKAALLYPFYEKKCIIRRKLEQFHARKSPLWFLTMCQGAFIAGIHCLKSKINWRAVRCALVDNQMKNVTFVLGSIKTLIFIVASIIDQTIDKNIEY